MANGNNGSLSNDAEFLAAELKSKQESITVFAMMTARIAYLEEKVKSLTINKPVEVTP